MTRGRPIFPSSHFKRENVVTLIHLEALKSREELMLIYKFSAKDRSLTTDFYTAKNQAEIMVVTSHGLDALWNPNSIVLGGRASQQAHTGKLLL